MVWALAAASALYWGLKLFVKAPAAPPHTQVAMAAPPAGGDFSRLLGADPAPEVVAATPESTADARFQLIGVVSPRSAQAAREGVALIAVDGKPAKAFRVGAAVDGQTVLQAVSARSATLGPRGGAALVALNIAPPPAAATGMLPNVSGGPGVPQPGMPQVMPNPAVPANGQNLRRAGPPPMQQPPAQMDSAQEGNAPATR